MIYQFGSQREMRAASAESWHPVTGFKETATCPRCHHIASEPHPINQIIAMDLGTYHKYLQRALVHVRISSWVGWVARQCNYRHYRHLNGKGPQASNNVGVAVDGRRERLGGSIKTGNYNPAHAVACVPSANLSKHPASFLQYDIRTFNMNSSQFV